MSKLNERRIGIRSLTEQIDTTTSGGKLIIHVFGAFAEFERDLMRQRTKAGLAAARARGRLGGRRKALDTSTKVDMAQALYNDKTHSIADIWKTLGVSRATLYRHIRPSTNPTPRRWTRSGKPGSPPRLSAVQVSRVRQNVPFRLATRARYLRLID